MMQKSKVYLFLMLVFAAIAFASCEKVINIDLKNASSIIVIEGNVTNRSDSQIVKIHRSVPFSESNSFPDVTGANVTIRDNNNGRLITLRERIPGFYMARNFTGRSGTTYTLRVEVDGEVFTATSTMPQQVSVDSLGVSVSTFLGEEQRTVQLLYTDPARVKNYYRFLLTINGKPSKNIFAYEDNFTDGRTVTRELFDLDLNARSGDTAQIEMQCIDPVVFRYWQGLNQNQNRGGASTTPANPVSNISNGALGYFSAHTRQNETIIIP